MTGSIRLGRILGITVQVHHTWFVALWAVAFSLARGIFPERVPGLLPSTYWAMGVVGAVLLFASVLVHEFGHALAARRVRIPTRSITLFLFGGVAQIAREPDRPADEFWVAMAGPATSLGLGALFYAAAPREIPDPAVALLRYLAWANLLLVAFNLIPAFPLDGGRVLRAVLWSVYGYERATAIVTTLGQLTALGFIGLGVVGIFTGQVLNGLWLVLIGWFLEQAAGASYRQAVLRRALAGMRVGDIMTRNVRVLPADLPLAAAVHDYFLPYKHGGYPVVYGDRLVGILTLHDLRRVPRERWPSTPVREAMTPIAEAKVVRPGLPAYEALARMLQEGVGRLLVVDEDGELVGLVTRSDLMHLIRVRTELAEG